MNINDLSWIIPVVVVALVLLIGDGAGKGPIHRWLRGK